MVRSNQSNQIFFIQNFDRLPNVPDENVTFYGGSVTLADYCPYVQEFTWRANSVVIRGSHCFYDENNPGTLPFVLSEMNGMDNSLSKQQNTFCCLLY